MPSSAIILRTIVGMMGSLGIHFFFWLLVLMLPYLVKDEVAPIEVAIAIEPAAVLPEPEPEPAPEPLPEPEPQREPEPEPTRERRTVPPPERVRPQELEPEPPPPASAEPPPVAQDEAPSEALDLSGTTLVGGGENAFAAPAGTGQTRDTFAIVRRGTGTSPGGSPTGTLGGTGSAEPIVALADLSRPPAMPELADALERNYPRELRDVEGQAVLRLRVRADGRLDQFRVRSATHPAFGEACRRTLAGARATAPPVDRQGRRVATEITYTCRFELY